MTDGRLGRSGEVVISIASARVPAPRYGNLAPGRGLVLSRARRGLAIS